MSMNVLALIVNFIGLVMIVFVFPLWFYKTYCMDIKVPYDGVPLPLVNTWKLWDSVFNLKYLPVFYQVPLIVGIILLIINGNTMQQATLASAIPLYMIGGSLIVWLILDIVISIRVYIIAGFNIVMSILMGLTLYIGKVIYMIWILGKK